MACQKFGIVIGNNYPNSDKKLKFAVSDAEKMKEILENKDICGFDNVNYFPDKGSREVSIAVDKILRKADNDLVFIYYSGHGKKDHEGKLCLLFDDTDEEALVATSLTFDFINKCLKYPSRKSVIIVLDCCYSGVAGIKNCDTDIMEEFKKLSGSGTIVLTSTGSTGSPTAREDEKLGHGIFTYYLIEGLEKGTADVDDDGLISIDELYDYAYKKTRENSTQSPKREGRVEGTIPIGKNLQKIREKECELIKKILREKEYEFKKKKLLEVFDDKLHPRIIDISLKIIRKNYDSPSSMEKEEVKINNYLESLLKDEFSIESYCDIVQQLKGISTNVLQSEQKDEEDSLEKIKGLRKQEEEDREEKKNWKKSSRKRFVSKKTKLKRYWNKEKT